MAPAIRLAEEGFPVSCHTAAKFAAWTDFLLKGENGHEMLCWDAEEGQYRAPRDGEVRKNPGVAGVLRKIAAEGKSAFYTGEHPRPSLPMSCLGFTPLSASNSLFLAGEIGAKIVEVLQNAGGVMTLDDLKAQMESGTSFEDPIHVNYRGVDVYEPGPNTQGVAALVALKILEARACPSADAVQRVF